MNFQISRKASLYLVVVSLALSLPAFASREIPGIHNFGQVNDHLYRGAQPTEEGFRTLARMGIRTIVDLREEGDRSAAERELVESLGMRYVNIPMRGFETPSDEAVAEALAIFNNRSAGPVFVHCRRGADRTGTVIACYRIEHDHWTNQAALNEAKAYRMSWLQFQMANYVRDYRAPVERASSTSRAATAGVSH